MTVIRHPNNQGVTLQQWRKTAAGGETSLSGTDDFSVGLAYTVGAEEVFVNGVLIERGVDYTATSGTSVTLTNALVAGDLATVSSPSAFNVANAIPKATVTAKGDVIVGTAASTVTNLAVGADGTTLVADSSTSTGLRYTAGTVQSNPVLNSAFQVWQRGTSVSLAASTGITSAYTADRWTCPTNANQASTISRQATNDTTNLPNIQYCARVQRNSGQTGTGVMVFGNNFESINSVPFAGKTVTFSFYARKGADYSPTSSVLSMSLQTGTGTDQNFYSYTGGVGAIDQNNTLTTTWQRFTATATLATNITELNVKWYWTPTGTAGANDYFEVTGVQIDIGSVALPFRTYAGTLQGELAACQRYALVADLSTVSLVPGAGFTTSAAAFTIPFPVTMRTAPSATSSGTFTANENGVGTRTFTALGSFGARTTALSFEMSGSSGLTVGKPLAANSGVIVITAEL